MTPYRCLLKVLFLVACVAPVPMLAGQTTVGLHGGLTRATFSDLDAPIEQESRSGIRLGMSATLPVSGSLGLRFAGSYVQSGGGFTLSDLAELGLDLDYFHLSVLTKAGLPMESDGVAVYLLAGPFAGFRTACSASASEQGVSISVDCDEADVDLSTTDFGLSGGVGVQVGFSESMGVALEALYDLGLKDLDDAKTRVLSIVAGLVFSL